MKIQKNFWDPEAKAWRLQYDPFVQFLYSAGVVPALAVGMAALGVLLAGIGRPDWAAFRKVSAYLVLNLVLGAGLITNLLLKGGWGRPRPSQVVEFGGVHPFEPVFLMDLASDGKSFPCGHATMGFFFFAVALVIPNRFLWLRWSVGLFALALGGALGFARSAQGGHFFSDSIWAAGVMWFTAYALFQAFKLSEDRIYRPKKPFRFIMPLWAFFAYLPILALGLLAGLLGTPHENKSTLKGDWGTVNEIRVASSIQVITETGDQFQIIAQSEGFGVPNSSVQYRIEIDPSGTMDITPTKKGFFTELRIKLKIVTPPGAEMRISRRSN